MAHAHSHSHDHAHSASEHRLLAAFGVIFVFMLVEVIGGIWAGSLALLADAAHMLTDAGALGLAWYAQRLSRRPADPARPYGYGRIQVLAAFVNGLSLLVLCVWILVEAVDRFLTPEEVLAGPMMAVAIAGLLANVVAFVLLHGAEQSMNVRGALLHVLGDLLGSVAALIAAAVITMTGWMSIDPLLSLLVVALIVVNAWRLVRRSGHILMQGAPAHLDAMDIRAALQDGVTAAEAVHDVRLWMLTDEHPYLTLHLRIRPEADAQAVLMQAKDLLLKRFDIRHTTIQIEPGPCLDPQFRLDTQPQRSRLADDGRMS
ncbi:MAG: cation diffusion facilitator family transporter [Rhodothalassiaceae bacterium]